MALQISDEVKALMYQTWLPALMTTVLEEVKKLPAGHRDSVLTGMCQTCEDLALAGAVGIQDGMSWDEYLRYLKEASPPIGPWTIREDGDVYDLVYDSSIGEDGRPRCHCPLVQLGMAEPVAGCCDGGARLAGRMIEAATGKACASAEVVCSPLRTGDATCHYRVHAAR
jgi:hypothetical protein